MKTTINTKELRELGACESGYVVFEKEHGCATVKFTQALDSNGWDDIWWLISNIGGQLSGQQQTDLHLLGCEYATSCLNIFEREFPEDKRPRLAIEAKKLWIKGEITLEELESAESAAWAAAESAVRAAARAAAWAARAAWAAAESAVRAAAAESAVRAASMEKNTGMLREVFLKWEE